MGELLYRRFAIVSIPRTGSHYLRGLLNSHPEIIVYGELFHADSSVRSRSLATRDIIRPLKAAEDVRAYANGTVFADYPQHIKAVGFKLVHPMRSSDPYFTAVCSYLGSQKVHIIQTIRRNLLDRYLSQRLAEQHNTYIKFASSPRQGGKRLPADYQRPVRIDARSLSADVHAANRFYDQIRRSFSEVPCQELAYEDLAANPERATREVLQFLGVRHEVLRPDTLRQRMGRQSRWIENYAELRGNLSDSEVVKYFEEDE